MENSSQRERPQVWVACVAPFTGDILPKRRNSQHGMWVEVPDSVEEMREKINEVLLSHEMDWEFHNYRNFSIFKISENEDLETLIKKANIINSIDNLEAFEEWDNSYIDLASMEEEEIIEQFHDEFLGTYEDEKDYAYQLLNECHEVPEYLQCYIDYESYWRDLSYSGYYSVMKGYKECFIFRSC